MLILPKVIICKKYQNIINTINNDTNSVVYDVGTHSKITPI